MAWTEAHHQCPLGKMIEAMLNGVNNAPSEQVAVLTDAAAVQRAHHRRVRDFSPKQNLNHLLVFTQVVHRVEAVPLIIQL